MGIEADTRSAVSLNDIVDGQRLTNPVVTRAAEILRTRTGSLTLSAPFCPRVKFLSVHPSGRWLVGAVGIEAKTVSGRSLRISLRHSARTKRSPSAWISVNRGTQNSTTSLGRSRFRGPHHLGHVSPI